MIKVFACFLLGCVVSTFGARRERIGYGRDVTESELERHFPFMVYVKFCNKEQFCSTCTGALVKPDRVLVAAHCFCIGETKITVSSKALKLGGARGKPVTGYRWTKGLPTYNCKKPGIFQADKDIALIALHRKLEVEPVPLFCGKIPLGTKIWLIGYGFNEKEIYGILRIATGRTAKCLEAFKTHHSLCMRTSPDTPTILPGDSGGPLLMKRGGRFVQIGVSSLGKTLSQLDRKLFPINVWSSVRPYCQGIAGTSPKSAGQHSAIGTIELVIQSFVLFIILNF